MATNKVKITIGGIDYSIITDDDVKYVKDLAREVDRIISKVLKDNPRLSSTQAAVLCALSYADEYKKACGDADRLRGQIKDYLDDASTAKSKADKARHDLEAAKKRIENLERENARLQAELDALLSASGDKK